MRSIRATVYRSSEGGTRLHVVAGVGNRVEPPGCAGRLASVYLTSVYVPKVLSSVPAATPPVQAQVERLAGALAIQDLLKSMSAGEKASLCRKCSNHLREDVVA